MVFIIEKITVKIMKKILLFLSFLLMSIGVFGTTETLTENEIKSNFTTSAHAYGDSPAEFNDGDVNWYLGSYNTTANSKWIQIRSNLGSYLKITIPENTEITDVTLTITSASNSSGGAQDITKHTAYSGRVALLTGDITGSASMTGVGYTNTITSNIATISPSGTNRILYLKTSAAARIWGITVTYVSSETTYTVTYNANGGTGTMKDSNSPYSSGATVTVLSNTFTAPSCKEFLKWGNSDGTDISNPFTITKDTVIYAQWTDIPSYSVTLKDSDIVLTQPNCTTGVTLPTREGCEGYTFVGWSTTNNTEWTTTQPTILTGTYKPSNNIDLYPVYTKTEGGNITWEPITSSLDDWSGEYVIVNPGGTHAMTSDFYEGTSGEFLGVSVNITNNKVVSPTDKMIWVVEKNGNNAQYSFKNKSTNSYANITGTDSKNADLSETTIWFTITTSGETGIWRVNSVLHSSRCFSYYDTRASFRTYANNNHTTGKLYKKSGGTTYYISSTDCSVEPPTPPTPEENIVDIIVWDTSYIKVDIKDEDIVSVSLDDKRLDVVENEATELFFSKYFEAETTVKLLGIYNGKKDSIDLSNYTIKAAAGDRHTTWDRTYELSGLGWIHSDEEIILYSYSSDANTDEVVSCITNYSKTGGFENYVRVQSGGIVNGLLQFNGDDAIGLFKGDKIIDIIGAGNSSSVDVSGLSHTGASGSNPKDTLGHVIDLDCWITDGADDSDGFSSVIGTNLCLLIRKSTVHSGDTAVKYNTTNFTTLATEWVGIPVSKHDSSTCKNFDYVGSFDYGNYYGSFEQIYEIDLSTPGILTDDGTYTLTLDATKYNLDTLPCTDLKFTLRYGNGTEKEEIYKVPIFIKSDSTVSGTGYPVLSKTICDSCDVVVMNGKSLKVNTTDTLKNRNVYVYPGATLIIPEGGKYKINSLTLRRDNNDVPYLSYKGSLNIKHGMFFEMRTDGSDWRWLTLPDNLRISTIGGNVRKDDGNIYTLFKHYDGAWRAEHGSGGWKLSPIDTVFNSGSGFIFGAYVPNSDTQKRLYRIPLDTNTLSQEKVSKFVTVYAYGNSNTAPNDKGWNVIGNPYYDSYVTGLDNPNAIRLSRLVKDTLSGAWNGKWIIDENAEVKDLRYIVIKSEETPEEIAAGGYKSVPIGIDNLELLPFTSFFIQAEDTAEVEFIKTSKKQRLVKTNYKPTGESFLRVCIGNNKTGCFISDKFTDEYEIGDDLTSLYSFYQSINGYKLLYSAVNDSIIEHGIKIYTSAGNLYLDDKTTIDDFEEINALYNGNWFDLLHGQSVNVSGEFILQAKRKVQNVATGLDKTNSDCIFDKYIQNGNVYIRKNNRIFTVLGELIK